MSDAVEHELRERIKDLIDQRDIFRSKLREQDIVYEVLNELRDRVKHAEAHAREIEREYYAHHAMTEKEAAKYLGVSYTVLASRRRSGGSGMPPYHLVGKAVRYERKMLDEWIKQQYKKWPEACGRAGVGA